MIAHFFRRLIKRKAGQGLFTAALSEGIKDTFRAMGYRVTKNKNNSDQQ